MTLTVAARKRVDLSIDVAQARAHLLFDELGEPGEDRRRQAGSSQAATYGSASRRTMGIRDEGPRRSVVRQQRHVGQVTRAVVGSETLLIRRFEKDRAGAAAARSVATIPHHTGDGVNGARVIAAGVVRRTEAGSAYGRDVGVLCRLEHICAGAGDAHAGHRIEHDSRRAGVAGTSEYRLSLHCRLLEEWGVGVGQSVRIAPADSEADAHDGARVAHDGLLNCVVDRVGRRVVGIAQIEVHGGSRCGRMRPFEVEQRLELIGVAAGIGERAVLVARQDLIDGFGGHAERIVEQRHGTGEVVGVTDDRDAVAGAVDPGIEHRGFVVKGVEVAWCEPGLAAECHRRPRVAGQRDRRMQVVEPVNRGDHTGEARGNLRDADVGEMSVEHGYQVDPQGAANLRHRAADPDVARSRIALDDSQALPREPVGDGAEIFGTWPELSVELLRRQPVVIAGRRWIVQLGPQLRAGSVVLQREHDIERQWLLRLERSRHLQAADIGGTAVHQGDGLRLYLCRIDARRHKQRQCNKHRPRKPNRFCAKPIQHRALTQSIVRASSRVSNDGTRYSGSGPA